MEEGARCCSCNTYFDTGKYIPLILSTCRHHICKECIKQDELIKCNFCEENWNATLGRSDEKKNVTNKYFTD